MSRYSSLFFLPGKTFFTFLLVLFSLLAVAQKKELAKVDSLLGARQYVAAHEAADAAVKKFPGNIEVQLKKVQVYQKSDSTGLAMALLERITKQYPGCFRCYEEQAVLFYDAGKYEQAMQALNKAVTLQPGRAYTYAIRSVVYFTMKNNEAADKDINQAISLHDSAWFHLLKSEYLESRGLSFSSMEELDKAMKMDTSSAVYPFRKAMMYINANRYDDALVLVNRCLVLDPLNYEYHQYKGGLLLAHDDNATAKQHFHTALSLNSRDYFSAVKLYEIHYAEENMDSSCFFIGRAVQLMVAAGPLDSALKSMLVSLQQKQAELCDPRAVSYYYQRGIAAFNTNSYRTSVNYYSIGLHKHPESLLLHAFRGNTYFGWKMWDSALAEHRLVTNDPDLLRKQLLETASYGSLPPKEFQQVFSGFLAESYYILAAMQLERGDADSALANLEIARGILPQVQGFPVGKYTQLLGRIYLARMDFDRAIEAFTTATAQAPENPDIQLNLYLARIQKEERKTNKRQVVSLGYSGQYQTLRGQWEMPDRREVRSAAVYEETLVAMERVTQALPAYAPAWWLMAACKQALGRKDYCTDALMAQQLGAEIADNFVNRYCK